MASTRTASARIFAAFRHNTAGFRTSFAQQQRRRYADAATQAAAGPEAVPQSGFAKFWNSEVGPKTVHFWAPIMKWCVVLAGAADFARPASQLSVSQNAALAATGAIWTRWCFVIKPRNLFLASVNFLLFTVGATQTTRALLYQRSIKDGGSTVEEVKRLAGEEKQNLKEVAEAVKDKVTK